MSLFIVISLAFFLAATLTLQMVGSVLLRETTNKNAQQLSSISVVLSSEWADDDLEAIYNRLIDAARQIGGRLLLVDTDGKVVLDTFDERCGTLLPLSELLTVITGKKDVDYGYHNGQDSEAVLKSKKNTETGNWEGCFVSAIVDGNGKTRAAVVSLISIENTVKTIENLRNRISAVFAVALIVVLLLSALLSGLITRPMSALSSGIERMSRGDYGTLVHVKGEGEMAELAAAFNEMSEKVHRLDESRSQFVSNASHELKTPLATIKILVETMLYQEEVDPDLNKEFLNDIDNEIDRLTAVVNDLLMLVKADNQKLTLHRERISFEDVVQESVRRLLPLAENKNISINSSISDPCIMEADKSKLIQVCYNIINNAIKYTPEGGSIEVSLKRSGRDAVLDITDNGIGILPEDLPHIFDRFYRADRSRVREEGTGTGLGLSIVRQIVRLHAGTVTVRSKFGEGSTFTVQLPVI